MSNDGGTAFNPGNPVSGNTDASLPYQSEWIEGEPMSEGSTVDRGRSTSPESKDSYDDDSASRHQVPHFSGVLDEPEEAFRSNFCAFLQAEGLPHTAVETVFEKAVILLENVRQRLTVKRKRLWKRVTRRQQMLLEKVHHAIAEVGELQAQCTHSAIEGRQEIAFKLFETLDGLLNELSKWCIVGGKVPMSKAQFGKILGFNMQMIVNFDYEAWMSIGDVRAVLLDTVQKELFSVFTAAVESACREVVHSIAGLDILQWKVYWNVMASNGRYYHQRGTINFNAMLCEPILRTLKAPWEAFFENFLTVVLPKHSISLSTAYSLALKSIVPALRPLGFNAYRREEFRRDNFRNFEKALKEHIDAVIRVVESERERMFQAFEEVLAEQMLDIYHEASTQETGTGRKARMRAVLMARIEEKKDRLFSSAVNTVGEEVGRLIEEVVERLTRFVKKSVTTLELRLNMMGAVPRRDGLIRRESRAKVIIYHLMTEAKEDLLRL